MIGNANNNHDVSRATVAAKLLLISGFLFRCRHVALIDSMRTLNHASCPACRMPTAVLMTFPIAYISIFSDADDQQFYCISHNVTRVLTPHLPIQNNKHLTLL